MKKLLLILSVLLNAAMAYGQSCVYHENMELIDSISSNNLNSNGLPGWNANTTFFHDGLQSYQGTYGVNDTAFATTDLIDMTGNTFVILSFWHICKLDFFDQGIVQVSTDGGATWIQLTCSNSIYLGGSSSFCQQANKFSEASYPAAWVPLVDTMPDQSWWRYEQFDVSAFLANVPNGKIRFEARDLNNNGMNRYGWLIDEICVLGAPCELTPPGFVLVPPVYSGTVYNNGPYIHNVNVGDNSGVASVFISISVNGGPADTLALTNTVPGDSLWSVAPPDTFSIGDTICYHYFAYDSSACNNMDSTSEICFAVSDGAHLPFCDNFDTGNLWTDSLASGSPWQLGTPSFGQTNSAHSPPNAWDIDLTSGYLDNTESYLFSPIFDFSFAVNSKINVWLNYNCEGSWDGTRLDYTTDNGATWQIVGSFQDANATNWYDFASINSSGQAAWAGNSGGWKNAIRTMVEPDFTFNPNAVQFRFVFTSDPSFNYDGFSIDDFCVTLPPPQDIGVSAIFLPNTLYPSGATADVKVLVKNYGLNAATNFDVYYVYNGVTSAPTNYPGVLAPGSQDTVYCPQFTVLGGTFPFCAYTALAADGDNLNDTICITVSGIQQVSITYCNNFDINGGDWTPIPSPTGNTTWELGTPNFGLTNSPHSAPNSWDINLNNGYDFGAETYLLSPIFDFSAACNARLEFWQNCNTEATLDGARLDYSANGSPWTILGSVGDPLATNWYTNPGIFSSGQDAWDGNSFGWIKSTYRMNGFNAIGLMQLRFAFNSSNFSLGDGISIDDFCMINPPGNDVGVDGVIEPFQNWATGQLSNVNLSVRNFGCNPITNFDVYYTYTGGPGPIGPVTYTGTPIPPNGTVNISCAQFVVPPGIYDFCGYTVMATDADNTNDTLCVQRKGLPIDTLNYCENFDGASANDWTPQTNSPGSAWELGAPAYGATTGAHSAPNAWDISLNSAYLPNTDAELLSPFFDMNNSVNAQLTFWQNRNCETDWDGTRIDYSLNGAAWTNLGYAGDPLGTNWYTNNAIISSGQPAWDGNSFGWIKSEYVMSAFDSSGLLQLKFIFTADPAVQLDGFSIDDFCLRIPPPQDAGCDGIISPTGGLAVGNTYYPTFQIKNFGSANMDSIPITYTINGGSPVTAYYYPVITPNGTGLITFTQGFVALSGGFTFCMYTGLPGDGDNFNDSCCITLVGIPTLTPTYTDDFDGLNNGWTTNNITPGTAWELGNPAFGLTTGTHSGPNCWDVNLFSSYQNNANCELISPYFDFTNVINAEVSFWINYSTEAGWDGPRLDYSSDGGNTFFPLGSVGCTGCTNWFTSQALFSSNQPGWEGSSPGWIFARDSDLSFLNGNGSTVIFKFVFRADGFFNVDGASIDDFNLYKPITVTAATKDIYPLNNILTPGPQYIVGRYTNKGTTPLNSVVLTLNIDNSTFVVTDTINPIPGAPLNLNKDTIHTFSAPWNASPGQHLLCIYTSYPNGGPDLDNSDDTTCAYLVVFDSTSLYPYCNDFETGPQWVALNSVTYQATSSWQIGTPLKPNLVGSHSGAKCWVTNLVNDYPDNDESSLFSPVFNVKANTCYNLDFWQNFDMDLFNDGGTIEYSIDSALTWHQFGVGGDQQNWMNATYIAAFGGPPILSGWTGFLGAWAESNHNFESVQNGTVIFRWRFASDATNTADGWAIDDVCFREIASPCVTSVGEPLADGFYLYQNTPNPASDITRIKFSLPARGKAELKVINLMGQVVDIPVNNVVTDSGIHTVDLNAKNLTPGIYFYSLRYDDKTITRRMVITN